MLICTAFVTESMSISFAVIFPMDLLEKGLSASNFAMLGLGDIVIPGELEWKRLLGMLEKMSDLTPCTLTCILLVDLTLSYVCQTGMKLLGGLLVPLHGVAVLHSNLLPFSQAEWRKTLLIRVLNWMDYSVTEGIAKLSLICIPWGMSCIMLRKHTQYM